MNISMLFTAAFLLLSGPSLSFAKEASKNNSKPIPSKIQYSAEQGYQPDNNSIYGSSDSLNPYGDLPGIYGGFGGPQEILRNRFSGSGSNSQDENQDGGYQNEQSTGGSGFQYPGSGEGNEVPNGVFSNPFLGQRRITSGIPSYGGTTNSGSEPGYGGSERGYGGSEPGYGGSERGYGGSEPGYGGGSYPGGRYSPSYGGFQPGIYSSSPSGFRPGSGQGFIYPTDQGYWYPRGGGGSGVGLRQPNYPYGGNGNGYGVYPGILRNIPAGILPSGGGSGIYGQIPRGYGPALFGYGQYPQMAYPGLGFDYGRLNESNPSGDGSYRNITPQGSGLPYPQSTPASVSPGESSQAKIKSLRKEDP